MEYITTDHPTTSPTPHFPHFKHSNYPYNYTCASISSSYTYFSYFDFQIFILWLNPDIWHLGKSPMHIIVYLWKYDQNTKRQSASNTSS